MTGRPKWTLAIAMVMPALAGCGGPDFTSGMRGGSYDSSMGGGYGAYGGSMQGRTDRRQASAPSRGVYPMVEASFDIPDLQGNPFDHTANDIQVTITKPDQKTMRIPAFFDGGATWRVRYTPDQQGRHSITTVTHNARPIHPDKLEPREFEVNGKQMPGFVRLDPRSKTRFAHDNGSIYYPIGMNVAWGDVVPILGKLGKAGGNWARVWMCHWGGANLDWVMNTKMPEGAFDLGVAKKWDEYVRAAEQAGIHLQIVLQHHGQYSTRVNPNWAENPWNKANGGFLATPGEFFVSARAIALTRAKYRYIVARWGHSPNVMAWELFNEVEWTDAIANKHADEVAAWHDGMAKFIRGHDPYSHLVTTSSSLDIPGLYRSMSYVQPHSYPSDALAVTGAFDGRKQDRPVFYGEIGPAGLRDDGTFLRRSLWSSLASQTAGAAQYWAWDQVDASDWYGSFAPAVAFVRESGFPSRKGLMPAPVSVTTTGQGPLTLRPGAGWAGGKVTEVTVPAGGDARTDRTFSAIPSYLQGKAHKEMFQSLTLKLVLAQPGSCSVTLAQVARAGAHVAISVDGKLAAEKAFAAAQSDRTVNDTIKAPVPAGEHIVKIENTGDDWAVIAGITLDPYAPALGVLGKSNSDYGVLWLYNRTGSAVSGKVAVAGVQAGSYDVVWFDTETGKATKRETVTVRPKSSLALTTPAIKTDTAMYFSRSGAKAARERETAPRTPGGRPEQPQPEPGVPSERSVQPQTEPRAPSERSAGGAPPSSPDAITDDAGA
ncbi:MAG: DUF5060 domain-containing protein [Armatimonadetes bacterium]|nr:DUF5060 domain-containing protein [Armatimonadota bacterium]